MDTSTTVESRASQPDRQYTPHEHEELRAVVTRWRTKERKPETPVPPRVIPAYKAP